MKKYILKLLFLPLMFSTSVVNAMIVYGVDEEDLAVVYDGTASSAEYSVANVGSASCVYLGNGWFISASHVSVSVGSTVIQNGEVATVDYVYSSFSDENDGVDLVLFYVSEADTTFTYLESVSLSTDVYTKMYVDYSRGLDVEITFVTAGMGRDSDSDIYDTKVLWGGSSSTAVRSQTDTLDSISTSQLVVFATEDKGSVALAELDSGSGLFYEDNGTYYLVGVAVGVTQADYALFGEPLIVTDSSTGSSTVYDSTGSIAVNLYSYIDNINAIISTTPIPEPSTYALILGIFALFVYKKRKS